MSMELFDTHAHLDDDIFAGAIPSVLEQARDAGICQILTIGTTGASSQASVQLAHAHRQLFAAVGIQPNYGAQMTPEDWALVEELAGDDRVRGIGETGLDACWDYTPFAVQQQLFASHLQLAQRRDLPVIVHMRDCAEATIEMLRTARETGPLQGVMHSFSGTAEEAIRCLQLGMCISFAGMVTFKKSDALREVARGIPIDRLLIETDSPYLAPHPHRGQKPNEPALLIHTARCLAELRGMPLDEFAAQTTANARRLFRIS
jgi:TatD DNase family protein